LVLSIRFCFSFTGYGYEAQARLCLHVSCLCWEAWALGLPVWAPHPAVRLVLPAICSHPSGGFKVSPYSWILLFIEHDNLFFLLNAISVIFFYVIVHIIGFESILLFVFYLFHLFFAPLGY
jgi:hypothetical protein